MSSFDSQSTTNRQLLQAHIVEIIVNHLESICDLAPIAAVCKTWHEIVDPYHKKQHHVFKYRRNLVITAAECGFHQYTVYKPVPKSPKLDDIQFAVINRLLDYDRYQITCFRTVHNRKTNQETQYKSIYILKPSIKKIIPLRDVYSKELTTHNLIRRYIKNYNECKYPIRDSLRVV